MNFKNLIQNENFQLTLILVLFTTCAILFCFAVMGSKCSLKNNNYDVKNNDTQNSEIQDILDYRLYGDITNDEDMVPDNMPMNTTPSPSLKEEDVNVNFQSVLKPFEEQKSSNEINGFHYKPRNTSLEGTPLGDYMSLDPNNKNPILTNESPYVKNQLAVSSDVPITGPMFNLDNNVSDEDLLRIGGVQVSQCNIGDQYYYLDDNLVK